MNTGTATGETRQPQPYAARRVTIRPRRVSLTGRYLRMPSDWITAR